MMRLAFLLGGLLFCASVQALDWKSDITLSPQPMTYSGPADSVVPGSIIGSTWSATASVQQVFWCGLIFTCTKGTLQPSSSAISSGATVTVDGANYTIFETGVPGVGYIIGLKDFKSTKYIPLQTGITQSYPAEGTSGYAQDLGWSAKVTFIKTGAALKSGVYNIPTINAAVLTAYNNETKTAQVIISPTTITVTASGCTVGSKNASVALGTIDIRTLPTVGSTDAHVTVPGAVHPNRRTGPRLGQRAGQHYVFLPVGATASPTPVGPPGSPDCARCSGNPASPHPEWLACATGSTGSRGLGR